MSNLGAMSLVFVPTPLGNLRDVTFRSVDALRDADLIVAEDTRVARRVLSARGVTGKEFWSYREQNAASVTNGILERARIGSVAVMTDAGMPGISDPGSDLIAQAREHGVPVEVLPGPSAALGVAVLSGFPLRRFSFEGFPPRSAQARRQAFERALGAASTSLWFESPQRLLAALGDLAHVAPDARVFLLREYTKMHEQHLVGTPMQVADALEPPIRGEIAFAIAPYAFADRISAAPIEGDDAIDALLDEGRSVPAIAKALAERGLGERRDLYARAAMRKRERGKGIGLAAE